MTETPFRWRSIIIPAFGPSFLFGISNGAVLPVIALSAIALGASHALSGLIAALVGFGSLLTNIPSAMVISRFGERRALMGAALAGVCALILCVLAPHPAMLAIGVFLLGMATSVFYLARQAFMMDAVPLSMRARAFSTLGGTQRMGMFIGPFAAAGMMHFLGLNGAYLVSIVALLMAGGVAFVLPELQPREKAEAKAVAKPSIKTIVSEHKRVLLTLGLGCMLISAMRASRQVAIPLWADAIGLDPTTTALVFGFVSSIDMLVFYPAGKIMDQYGRLWVALPCALTLAISFLAIPLTATTLPFVLVCLLMGLGNGIGSGIVMTLGADGAPANGRHEFLGVWRLITDAGTSAGPFILSGMTALISLGVGIAVVGSFGLIAAGIFWHALPHRKLVNDASQS